MRVAHVTISHGPLDVRIFQKECRTLVAAGHEVHLFVCEPVTGEVDGVHFHSLPDLDTANAYFWEVWRRLPEIYRRSRAVRADVYHLPDPSLIPLGVMLKLRGAKVVYDAHEDRPRHAITKYYWRPVVGRISALIWRILERLAMRYFDGFVAATPAIAQRFPRERTVTVCNFPLQDEFRRNGRRPIPYRDRPPHAVYMGSLKTAYGIREMIRAIELIPEAGGTTLLLAGDFHRAHPGFRQEVERMPGWERVDHLGSLARPDAIAALDRGRMGLVLLEPRPEHLVALGNKMFEYMAAGLPVIASNFPLWQKIVSDGGLGLTVDPTDTAAIAGAIRWILANPAEGEAMGRRGQEAVANHYNWGREERKLLALYRGLEAAPG
jgi:glycosyltransferase involved in cell wall biosynthesis